ncbi:hypothetical protein HIM_10992 [Hirsutella minnesotensis 3608]|uniref:BZIP domain-containing protein n=1 Tax=Hirsutella minnesotensis 3608 TaxID=1043627 RepID=A0A0F8A1P4_9HYPO|nr:hypothetical protein HIM_10992 [Hirsutella minnesotensis 3608]
MGAPHHSTPRKARLRGAFEAAVALNLPVSKRQLFELHGVSRRTGNRILSDLSDRTRHNQPNRPETRGRKRILKDADVNAIEDLLEKEGFEARRLPWVSMPAEAGVDTDASKRTIQRSLERRGWYKRKAQQVDYTDPKLAARRIEYAKEALAQRPEKEDWHDIFFSDETHFGYDDERDAQIARPPGTRNRPENLQEKRIPKDTEVKLLHAWACIGYNFKSPLVWYEVSTNTNGKMSQKVYLEKVLEGYVKPELLEKGVSFILEEDGDSGHGPGKNNPVRAWKEKHGLRGRLDRRRSITDDDRQPWPPLPFRFPSFVVTAAMDFTGPYHHHFPGAQPYQSFMPIQPLASSHAQSAAVSDDFNASSAPDAFEPVAAPEHFQGFDFAPGYPNASQAHHSQQQPPQASSQHHPSFGSSPTPPPSNNASATPYGHQRQSQRHHLPPASNTANGRLPGVNGAKGFEDVSVIQRGSDEDDFLTPAQSRRKAQNRAAQRAFRERKEKHVKDLEAKLASLEAAQQKASVENERLKRDLQKISTENEILRATSAINNRHNNSISPEPPSVNGPMQYNPADFYSNVLQNYQNKFPSHRVITSDDGERLLAAGATWDFIISHDLYKRGLVDVGDVSERLKNVASSDGQGPVFSESTIIQAIEQSVASGSDDLL